MSDLKDFLYLDTAKLHSFIAQIGGGIVDQISETIKKHGGLSTGLEVGLPPLSGKVGVGKQVENERQQTLRLTDPAYFAALYDHLKTEKTLYKITNANFKREKLKVGQFIEIHGLAEPPAIEYWISHVKSLMDFFDRNMKLFGQIQSKNKTQSSISKQQMMFFKGILNFLEDYIRLTRKDPGKEYIRVVSNDVPFYVWCGLIPEYSTPSLDSILPTEVCIVGRIEKILGEGQSYKIVDFSNFDKSTDATKLLDILNSLSTTLGQKEIKEKDLQAEGPDIFVTPIAIYR